MALPRIEESLGMSGGGSQAHMKNAAMEQDKSEPIAVVGFALKFPQDAVSVEGFWQMLIDGRSAMTEIPQDRWNVDAFYQPNPDRLDSMNARGGHFLKESVAVFDAPFFSLPPNEVECMDPQQRSLLECTYQALENAGIPMAKAVGSRASVHVGSMSREYEALIAKDPQMQAKYLAVGTGPAMLANRISWFYDLHGPSIPLDTACSSSLNALHLSVQSLRSGESSMGLVAGCNLILNPETQSIPLSNLGFLSPDSKCYSFDHRANGYARGEGTAVIVLKRLSQAISDNDTIRAVIRATGTNQDGKTPGITQPSQEAQEILIRETYSAANLNLQDTGFFEAHGTGTAVGDPREAGAIGAVFKNSRRTPLIVGAVKSNIGHLEGASGLAGLIKTILILERGIIPRNIWFEKPNPAIKTEAWGIKFPIETTTWPTDGLRRASVNSFGYGGANTHVVVDDAYHYLKSRGFAAKHHSVEFPPGSSNGSSVPVGSLSTPYRSRLYVLSTSDEGGLNRLAASYEKLLQDAHHEMYSDRYLDNLAYTLSDRRSNLPWKCFLVAHSIDSVREGLTTSQLSKPVRASSGLHTILGFIFTGQGAQWYAMGRELLIYPTFQNSLRSAEKYFQTLGSKWLLIDELNKSEDLSPIDDPTYAQPLCTALQIALVELLATWRILPTAVVGHSSGEIAAAFCVGGLSRESALKIAYFRGVLASCLAKSKQRNGSMIAVALSEADILPYLAQIADYFGQDRLSIGCVNSPSNVTVTGDEECIDALKSLMEKERVFARKLQVAVAYHSSHMEDIASEYKKLIERIIPGDTRPVKEENPTFFSSVTGFSVATEQLSQADYWVSNMVSQVKFSDALSQMCSSLLSNVTSQTDSAQVQLVEIGPHAALRRPVTETLGTNPEFSDVSYDNALFKDVSAVQSMLELMGRLHCRGFILDLVAINSPELQESELQLLCDLPEYSFNHSQSYWLESRLSRNFRFREHPRHELLGIAAADWNPYEGKWRNILRVSENPWIRDHKFNGSELYPAAGMFVMAIEASRQMANRHLKIRAYKLENVSIFKPLLVSLAPEGVETQFHLRYDKRNSTQFSDHNTFHLYLWSTDEWTELCHGTIITEYSNDEVNIDISEQHLFKELYEQCKDGIDTCARALNSQELYENLASFGFWFGDTFQTLKHVRFSDDHRATAETDPREWMAKVPESSWVQDHVIHPTALDAVMHLTIVALSKGTWEPIQTMVPTKIKKLWVSNDLLVHSQSEILKLYARTTFRGYRDAEASVYAFDSDSHECRIMVEGYRGTAISSLESSITGDFAEKKICFDVEWKPDLDLLTTQQLSLYCDGDNIAHNLLFLPEAFVKSELICLYFMRTALEIISKDRPISAKPHITKYVAWMKHQCDQYESGVILPHIIEGRPSLENKLYFEELINGMGDSPEEELFIMVGNNLIQILQEKIDALEFLFDSNLLQRFYAGTTFNITYTKVAKYIDLLAHKDPTLKILEIGAGTGGISAAILDKLARNSRNEDVTPRYSQYIYTDISPGFFKAAKDRFSKHLDRMTYQVLDIEKDPIVQGFKAQQYDLVIASSVLHATGNIDNTLTNTRKLLKPGGKLILIEPCNLAAVRISFIFGLLPGWWLSQYSRKSPTNFLLTNVNQGTEEYRCWGPLLTNGNWRQALIRNGFLDDEVCLQDFQDMRHTMSVIVSSNSYTETVGKPSPQTYLVITENSVRQSHVASDVETELRSFGVSSCEVLPLRDLRSRDLKGTFCIFLLELDDSLLLKIQEEDFVSIKWVVQSASQILWLTCGRAQRPEFGLITGLGRSIYSEIPDIDFIELAIDEQSSPTETVQHITKVYQGYLTAHAERFEPEYLEKDNVLHINRLTEASYLDNILHAKFGPQKPQMKKFGQEPERCLSLTVHTPGLLNTLHFEEDEMASRKLAADEVDIEVQTTGVNFQDVLVALGQIPANTIGLECSGVVLSVGHEISETLLRPGDRVCCIADGTYKSRVRTCAAAVAKIPDAMSFTTAAAFPLVFCIAYYALIVTANLKEGESVLISSGAGGVGQAAIQLAKMLKAEVYVAVGTKNKGKLLMDLYQIPADHIFVGRDAAFTEKLKQVTGGVDVVLSSLHGKVLRRFLSCLAPFGRLIDITKTDVQESGSLAMSLLSQNATYSSVDMALFLRKSKSLMANLMRSVMELVACGRVTTPQPLSVYKCSELEDSFRYLQSGKNVGKVVIEMHKEDVVSVMPSNKPTYYFDKDASYVIVGGLGGLGRSIARWMVARGAKHLILLGRSGARSESATKFVKEMEGEGIDIAAPPCDITDKTALQSTLDVCLHAMPAIKGCIQGSMALKDTLFENMSLDDYYTAVKPKAQGSWNLHLLLPKNMDFFVLLASAGGVVGNRGQSNYASGNTYQDALAHHRVSLGQKCVSLDLGLVLSVGFAAENRDILGNIKQLGFTGIREAEFLAILDYLCDPSLPLPLPLASQIVTGVEVPKVLKNKESDQGKNWVRWIRRPLFRGLAELDGNEVAATQSLDASADYEALFKAAGSPAVAARHVAEGLRKKLSKTLLMPEEDVDMQKPIHSYGVDSLVAVEMRYWMAKEMKADVSIFDIMGNGSLAALSLLIAEKSGFFS